MHGRVLMSLVNTEKGYERLDVWKRANEFTLAVYKHSKSFPKNEEYGLTSQLKRAALSVPTNIVEGQASTSKREFLNFLNIANRSLVESEYLLGFALELQYLEKNCYEDLEKIRRETGAMLNGLMRSVRSKL